MNSENDASVSIVEINETELPNLEFLKKTSLPKRKIYKFIEGMDISADAKALLFNMTDVVIKVGKVLIHIGRAVLSAVIELIKLFPTLAVSVILAKFLPFIMPAALVKIKVAAIIGKLLPLLGVYVDMKDMIKEDSLKNAAKNISERFFPTGKTVGA